MEPVVGLDGAQPLVSFNRWSLRYLEPFGRRRYVLILVDLDIWNLRKCQCMRPWIGFGCMKRSRLCTISML